MRFKIKAWLFGFSLLTVFAFLACSSVSNSPPADHGRTITAKGSGGHNATEHLNKPIVLMISIDGFRYDYMEKHGARNLLAIAAKGARAEGMIPSFPSLTFPNHITLVTGRAPGEHGIVSNKFIDEKRHAVYSMMDGKAVNDSSWYLSDTLWSIAEKNKMVSAVFFWVGSEAKIGGVDPTYFQHYDGTVANGDRVDRVIEWLKLPVAARPHFIGLYFSDVDSAGHKYGPDSKEVAAAVLEIDGQIGRLNDFIEAGNLPVDIIVVSDHGMQSLGAKNVITLSDYTDMSGFSIGDRGPVMNIYSDDAAKIERAYLELKAHENHFQVFRRGELPAEYHYAHPDRVGDLIVVAEMPYYLYEQNLSGAPPKLNAATHGWAPSNQSMHALFIAKGPQIKAGVRIPEFSNVHVFPFVAEILGLPYPQLIEGDPAVLKPLIAK